MGMNKTCTTCEYYSGPFVSVCCNGESEHCADFVGEEDGCERWEKKDGD